MLQAAGIVVFSMLLSLINYSFSSFAMSIINRQLTLISKTLIVIPWLLILLMLATAVYCGMTKNTDVVFLLVNRCSQIVLLFLFVTFVFCSVKIFINLKNIQNIDLKKALKILALLFIIFIPVQTLIIIFLKKPLIIFLSRNIFYLLINVIGIGFAAKYFFKETPSIMDKIVMSRYFIEKFSITEREKEVIYLLLSGLSIKEIGARLNRSFKTVNNHIYNIYSKANISSKLELLNLIKEYKI